MLENCQNLKFDERPDYKYMKSLLQKIIKKSYNIKRMSEIDILKNNNEEIKK